jgi:hypothetical protein
MQVYFDAYCNEQSVDPKTIKFLFGHGARFY